MTVPRQTSDAIRTALRGYEPTPQQWEVIRAPLEPVAIVAGAGSGKTAVMTARIIHLVEEGLARPHSVLGLTFTNKAAGELAERLSEALGAMVPHPREHPTVMTYNAFAQKIVREHGPRIGVDGEAGVLTLAQKWQILEGLIADFPSFEVLELRHPLSFIPQTLDLADGCANHLVTPGELEAECDRLLEAGLGDKYADLATRKRRDFAKILEIYIARKRRLRRIDFGDQISLAYTILDRFPAVATELREKTPVVLLDEYQDTNPAQKEMLRLLCPPGSAVTAVGDARQAIYGWRGASMYNLLSFHNEFVRADGAPGAQATLQENFRSGRRIVELANRIIDRIPAERGGGGTLKAVPANGDGWAGASLFTDEMAEAAFIADEIERLHEEGLSWRDMAILIRSRRYMDAIAGILEERDIPVEMPELGGLLKIPCVVDTVAWLRALADASPASNRWIARILMGPRFRIDFRDLAPVAKWAVARTRELGEEVKELLGEEDPDPGEVAYSLSDALGHIGEIDGVSPEAVVRIQEFMALLEGLRADAGRPLGELAANIVERTGIADALRASTSRAAPAMLENLHGFLSQCAEFSPLQGEPNIDTFLEFLDVAETSEDPIPLAALATSDSVKLMTVHAAKGLEFDTVFLPVLAAQQDRNPYDNMRKGSVFPDVRTSSPLSSTTQLPPGVRRDRDHLPVYVPGKMQKYRTELRERAEEDERRLFYVAVTRARRRLYLSGAHWYGSQDKKGASIYLDEVMDHTDLVDLQRRDEAPPTNPVVESMRDRFKWPVGTERPAAALWFDRVDDLLAGRSTAEEIVALGGPEARELYQEHVRTIDALASVPRPATAPVRRKSLAATAAVRMASGKAAAEDVLHPLPTRPSEAQRLGIEVHAWIEEVSRGLGGLAEEDALEEASVVPDRRVVDLLKENYRRMGYEGRTPARLPGGEVGAEIPFVLKAGDTLVRGRIDAVYESPDGLEIVDFKTGEQPEEPDWSQLELYAEALHELGLLEDDVTLTYAWLKTGSPVSKRYAPRGVDWLVGSLPTAAR